MDVNTNLYAPPIAFLGVSENVNESWNNARKLRKISILNLRKVVFSSIFPLNVANFSFVFAFYNISSLRDIEIFGKEENSEKLVFKAKFELINDVPSSHQVEKFDESNLTGFSPSEELWNVISVKSSNGVLVFEPVVVGIYWKVNDQTELIGKVSFLFVQPNPLSIERILAIKSDPKCPRYVRWKFQCNLCFDELIILAGIDRDPLESNQKWYLDLPEYYECKCKANIFSLEYLKKGLPYFIGNSMISNSIQTTIEQMYNRIALMNIRSDFIELLNTDPSEENVQVFLKNNPIVFYQFKPFLIKEKAPILSRFKTDFTILSRSGELYLVEIEKPGKRIIKSDGGRTSDFNHPFDQVMDWLNVFKDHRMAILDDLDIDRNDVTYIKGVVIIGREERDNKESIFKYKSSFDKEILFYTYDDLILGLETLIININSI